MEEKKKIKPKSLARKKRRRSKTAEPEKIIRAVQHAAGAVLVAYKVIKPHLHKLKRKKGRLTR